MGLVQVQFELLNTSRVDERGLSALKQVYAAGSE
jgi:hypothetical protein